MIEIKLLGRVSIKGYTLLEGFPGAGLVGPMAISYIVEKLGMHYIGYIESTSFPPLIAIHNSNPLPAIRIYASPDSKIVTILAEFAIPLDATYELANKLYDFVKANGMAGIISIGGMPIALQNVPKDAVFAIASTPNQRRDVQKAGIEPIDEGVATGISALVMLKSVGDSFPDTNILVPVDPNALDPGYAETAIKALNKLIDLKVDVRELDREAKEVEAKINEMMNRNKAADEAHRKSVQEAGPPTYA